MFDAMASDLGVHRSREQGHNDVRRSDRPAKGGVVRHI